MILKDIEMLPLEGGILRRLLVTQHVLLINQAERSISLTIPVLHYRETSEMVDVSGDGKQLQFTFQTTYGYIGKGDGKKWYKLDTSDRKLVDVRTGLNVDQTAENAAFLMPEFSYLEKALQAGTGILELVQAICQRNVDRQNFDTSTYEVI